MELNKIIELIKRTDMKASIPMRVFFAFMSCMLWAGIALTGIKNVNWILFVPAGVSLFAAITGICPSLMMITKILGPKQKATIN